MAEEFIEQIYSKSIVITELKIAIKYLRIRNIDEFSMIWTKNADMLISIYQDAQKNNWTKIDTLYKSIISVRDGMDDIYKVLGILEEILIPTLTEYMRTYYSGIDVENGGWRIFSTGSGFLSISNTSDSINVHDIIDPLFDAYEIAGNMYTGRKKHVLIFGAGLGYLPYAIWKYSNESAYIHIIEPNEAVVAMAHSYGVLDWIDPDYLDIKTGKEWFEKNLELDEYNEEGLCIISDYVKKEFPDRVQTSIQSYMEYQSGHSVFEKYYSINYWRNCDCFDGSFYDYQKEVEDRIKCHDFIVVASGPSVDENIEYIRSNVGKKPIIAVNSIIRKLLKEGINPDIVCLLDPTKEVYEYLPDEDDAKNIPLIAESVAYWKYVRDYSGKKYSFFSTNYEPAQKEREKLGGKEIKVGATVTSMAIAIAIELNAQRIEVIGMDLGFPMDKLYANNIGDKDELKSSSLLNDAYHVESVDGGVVNTVNTFNVFRTDVEKQIRLNPEVEYWNLSLHGAYVQGMISGTWLEDKRNQKDNNFNSKSEEEQLYATFNRDLTIRLRRMEAALVNPIIDWNNSQSILNRINLDLEILQPIEKESVKKLLQIWKNRSIKTENIRAQVYINSILANGYKDEEALIEIVNQVLNDEQYTNYELSFIFWQIKNLVNSGKVEVCEKLLTMLKKLEDKYLCSFLAVLSEDKKAIIDKNTRKKDFVIYVVDSFCNGGDVEKAVLDECANMITSKNKKILLINSAEACHMSGSIPFYQYQIKEYCPEYSRLNSLSYKGTDIAFYQCDYVMPDREIIELLIEMIQRTCPEYVIYKGEGGVLGNLAQHIVPDVETVNV